MIGLLAAADLLEQFVGAGEAAGDGDVHIHTGHIEGGLLDGIGAADGSEVQIVEGLTL